MVERPKAGARGDVKERKRDTNNGSCFTYEYLTGRLCDNLSNDTGNTWWLDAGAFPPRCK